MALAVTVDCAAIVIAYLSADLVYMTMMHGFSAMLLSNPQLGVLTGLIFSLANLARQQYAVQDYLNVSGHAKRVFSQWSVAFLAATTLAFLGHIIEDSSRGVFLIFYGLGLASLYVGRAAMLFYVREKARAGRITASRAYVVGFPAEISGLLQRLNPQRDGVRVVAIRTLPADGVGLEAALADAVVAARALRPDDVIIAAPWTRPDQIDQCITALMRVPAALHLEFGPDCVMSRFAASPDHNRLMLRALQLRGYSMTDMGGVIKRVVDIVIAGAAFLILSPLLLALALAIKLDSPGPVFFRQQRHGFNKETFGIWKFRTMTVSEDGDDVRQARRNDVRITKLGAKLRRYNIDELPQLINVLLGEMSLVGPRPHAIIHDNAFEANVALYARRHNVLPGITGWAQVNGFRGETDTQEKITQRIEHDLYYIDNWSLALDLWILVLTLVSRKAYANAR